jgi:hypothetical protein
LAGDGVADPSPTTLVNPAKALKVTVGSLLEHTRRRIMSEHEHYPTAFLPITQRILASFAKTLNEERTRAVEEGLPGEVVLEGTLNTLLWFAARIAARIIFPGEDPDSKEGHARASRIQRAVSQALVTTMAHEKDGAVEPDAPSWPDRQGGHA